MKHAREICCAWGELLSVSPTLPVPNTASERIPLIEPEIMVSGEHKYSWNSNKEVITCLYKHWCLQNSPWKDLVFAGLLSLSHVPGERIGTWVSPMTCTVYPQWLLFMLKLSLPDSLCPIKANLLDDPLSAIFSHLTNWSDCQFIEFEFKTTWNYFNFLHISCINKLSLRPVNVLSKTTISIMEACSLKGCLNILLWLDFCQELSIKVKTEVGQLINITYDFF